MKTRFVASLFFPLIALLSACQSKIINEQRASFEITEAAYVRASENKTTALFETRWEPDCYKEPTIWRYYIRKQHFDSSLERVRNEYPFLNLSNVEFRLFDTKLFGRPQEADGAR